VPVGWDLCMADYFFVVAVGVPDDAWDRVDGLGEGGRGQTPRAGG
jgi:hypothetical protein